MFNLGATEDQLDFPTVYGSAKGGWMGETWKTPTQDVSYLLDQIITHIPQKPAEAGNLQMMISSLDYSSYVGRIAIGRLKRGTLTWGQNVSIIKRNGKVIPNKVKELYVFEGLGKEKQKEPIYPGEICAILGLEDFDIGDTIADFENPEQLDPFKIDEPTMSMLFTINTSPFFGQDGKYVTSRHLRDRLFAELEKNLALSIQETNSPDMLNVFGRGILHLSILIETMRREGYELQVGQPQVIKKEIEGVIHEPIEQLSVLVPEGFESKVIDYVSRKKGELVSLDTINDRIHLDFRIPSRGIIGLRNQILTATEGEAIISHRFLDFEPWKGEISGRHAGALIAMETGQAYAYAIDKLQDRGNFYIDPGEMVYTGQVIGEHIRQDDLIVNVCKSKKLTNMRASGSDEKMKIAPSIKLSLEEYMEAINKDEYLEITPRNLRLRKILLDEKERKRATKIE
jgi:GTP-binding protein